MSKKIAVLMMESLVLGLVGLGVVGCGSPSSSESQTVRVVIAPTNLTVVRAANSAVLSWEASSDTGVGGYLVYRGTTTDTASFAEVGNTIFSVRTYTDTGLTSSQRYYYAVRAVTTASEQSAYSNIATAEAYSANLPITINGGKK